MVQRESLRRDLMGSPIDLYSFADAIEEIECRITKSSHTNLIHFLNAAKIVRARSQPLLAQALWDSDLIVADGKPLLLVGRTLGIRIPTRVNGTDLMEALIALAARKHYRLYFLGAKEEVLEKCVDKTRSLYPDIDICGYRNGYFSEDETDDVIADINSARPDIVFIGMPTPRKEMFAFLNRSRLHSPIVQGVGGSFDILSGQTKRAPSWMQRSGLEWLYRVLQEPRRLFWRYFSTNIVFLAMYIEYLGLRILGRRSLTSIPKR